VKHAYGQTPRLPSGAKLRFGYSRQPLSRSLLPRQEMRDGSVDLQLGCAASKSQPGSRPAAQTRAFGLHVRCAYAELQLFLHAKNPISSKRI
jgi:hypothetical protein